MLRHFFGMHKWVYKAEHDGDAHVVTRFCGKISCARRTKKTWNGDGWF